MLIESLSGVRGYDSEFSNSLIKSYAFALHLFTGCKRVAIGRDSRASGERIKRIFIEALQGAGVDVYDLGLCPTPTVQFSVINLKMDNGVCITASHNPLPWNGIKFIGSDGKFLTGLEVDQLKKLRRRLEGWLPAGVKLGEITIYDKAGRDHIESTLHLPYVDVEEIKARHFRVVVDTVNGAASYVIPELLKELGCEVIPLYCDPNQPFPHTPEPLPENLIDLCNKVREVKADLGLAIDPDGDRLAIIDENGKPISEEYTIVLATWLVLRKSQKEKKRVVVNLSTTQAVDDLALMFGAEVIRTPIGEINVAQKMEEVNAVIGGEGNGGVILPESHLGRDSLVGTALILQLLAEEGKKISELVSQLPHYFMVKRKVERGTVEFEKIKELILQNSEGAKVNQEDGIKLSWQKGWVHIRASNTEPILRIYGEAPTQPEAEELVDKYVRLIKGLVN